MRDLDEAIRELYEPRLRDVVRSMVASPLVCPDQSEREARLAWVEQATWDELAAIVVADDPS